MALVDWSQTLDMLMLSILVEKGGELCLHLEVPGFPGGGVGAGWYSSVCLFFFILSFIFLSFSTPPPFPVQDKLHHRCVIYPRQQELVENSVKFAPRNSVPGWLWMAAFSTRHTCWQFFPFSRGLGPSVKAGLPQQGIANSGES